MIRLFPVNTLLRFIPCGPRGLCLFRLIRRGKCFGLILGGLVRFRPWVRLPYRFVTLLRLLVPIRGFIGRMVVILPSRLRGRLTLLICFLTLVFLLTRLILLFRRRFIIVVILPKCWVDVGRGLSLLRLVLLLLCLWLRLSSIVVPTHRRALRRLRCRTLVRLYRNVVM